MSIRTQYSRWGIKDHLEDIQADIMQFISAANSFIILGGYNFSYQTSNRTMFHDLAAKTAAGIPALIIMPPSMQNSHHIPAINFCLNHGIGLILNSYNHSKWLLTENHLYFGSSNFSFESWRNKIEVISFRQHRFPNLQSRSWPNRLNRLTVLDFLQFTEEQIRTIRRRTSMSNYPNSRAYAVTTWRQILQNVQRLNPSVEKVKKGQETYEENSYLLSSILEEAFVEYESKLFEVMALLNSKIQFSLNQLCEYGYTYIFNEFDPEMDFGDAEIETYNKLHKDFENSIENAIGTLDQFRGKKVSSDSELVSRNMSAISRITEKLNLFSKNDPYG